MKLNEINIRDPFIIKENGKWYLFGTRAKDFGVRTGGFDVYISEDLIEWSNPIECCNTEKQGLNNPANWAPEIWKYNNKFYMLATFLQKDGLRGTFALVSEKIIGPYEKCSENALTPKGWECLDGTLYIDKNNKLYLVFCHEHTQIIDGTMCYIELKDDFTGSIGEPVTLFAASEPYYVSEQSNGSHYVTDGPFMFRTKKDELVMIWSTFINGQYVECMAYSDNGEINGEFIHIDPLFKQDGGHGMIFEDNGQLNLILHTPNVPIGSERPIIYKIKENSDGKGFGICE